MFFIFKKSLPYHKWELVNATPFYRLDQAEEYLLRAPGEYRIVDLKAVDEYTVKQPPRTLERVESNAS